MNELHFVCSLGGNGLDLDFLSWNFLDSILISAGHWGCAGGEGKWLLSGGKAFREPRAAVVAQKCHLPCAAAQPGDSAWFLCCSPDSALGLVTAAGTSASSAILLPVTPAIFSHFMSGPGQPHLLSFLISNIPVATQSVWILSEAIP